MGLGAKARSMVAVGTLMLAAACSGSDDTSRTVTRADVTNLPPGNATGSTYSGVYVLSDGVISACDCRKGSCSQVRVAKGDTFTLTQTDGALHVTLRSAANTTDQLYDGGINRGGDFRVGSSFMVENNVSYSLLSGTVTAEVSVDAQSRVTFVGAVGGEDYDCDFTGDLVLSFSKPL